MVKTNDIKSNKKSSKDDTNHVVLTVGYIVIPLRRDIVQLALDYWPIPVVELATLTVHHTGHGTLGETGRHEALCHCMTGTDLHRLIAAVPVVDRKELNLRPTRTTETLNCSKMRFWHINNKKYNWPTIQYPKFKLQRKLMQ